MGVADRFCKTASTTIEMARCPVFYPHSRALASFSAMSRAELKRPPAASGRQNPPLYQERMIRITITAAAFDAIAATLPSNVGVEQNRAPNGDYFIWLDPRFVDRLRAMRGPGESYSDVILRLAKG